MDFEERQLRAFIAVAETGSLGRAARIVHLTQPSLSRLIQGMEHRLGHRLFEREAKGMALTAAGTLLLPHARMLVFEMQAARDELDALRGLRRGTVRIGALAAVMRALVAPALGRLLDENPGLTAEAREGVDSELFDALLQRQIDLAVTASLIDDPGIELVGMCAYSDHFAVFCATAHPLPESPAPPDLKDYNWVMPGPAFTPRVDFEAMLHTLGLPPPVVAVEASSVETMIALSAHSRLLCWLPEPLLAAHLANATMRKLAIPALGRRREFRLYRRRSGLLPDAARQFVRHFPLLA